MSLIKLKLQMQAKYLVKSKRLWHGWL